jgi:4-amino-4-deoxy-L-arabinose transferase-like glycosyltransferase
MRTDNIIKKPFLLFLPFLLFYILYIFIFNNHALSGDEPRYLKDAGNLLQGYYSPPLPDITLYSGPGYPLIVLPFVAFKIPFIVIKLLNAFFLYFSIVLLYKVLSSFVSLKKTLLCCFFWGCYYNSFKFLPEIKPEIICPFIVMLLLFLLTKAFSEEPVTNRRRYLLLSGFVFGFLILVKVIFGYVLLCMLLGCSLVWLFKRKNVYYRRAMLVILVAFITVSPYLFYTYHITGRVLYWSSMGGNNLYWMSTYDEQENGSWFVTPHLQNDSLVWNTTGQTVINGDAIMEKKSNYLTGYLDSIIIHNGKALRQIALYKDRALEQDDVYKKMAIENITAHPVKFIKNCFSNIGRILFNFPYSYSLQKPATLLRLPMNGILLVLMLFCAIPTVRNWRQIPFAIRFMLFVSFLYLGGSILGSAEVRMFTVIVPVLLVWIAYIIQRSVKIKFTGWSNGQ